MTRNAAVWTLLALFLAIHGPLSVYGYLHPEAVLAGDRARSRLKKMQYVLQGHEIYSSTYDRVVTPSHRNWWDRVIDNGPPGDYLFHALAQAAGGMTMVTILQQVGMFAAVYCVFRLAQCVGLSVSSSLLAGALYTVLPGSIILPHQLASEAVFNPLVVIACFLMLRDLQTSRFTGSSYLGFACLGGALLVRAQLFLFPIVAGVVLWRNAAVHARSLVVPLAIAYAAPALWSAVVYQQRGVLATKAYDINPQIRNIATAERVARIAGDPFAARHYHEQGFSTRQLAAFIAARPSAYLQLKVRELANFVVNPGTFSVVGHHFRLSQLSQDTAHWKRVRDERGWRGVAHELWQSGPLLAVVCALTCLLWLALLVVAGAGLLVFLSRPEIATGTKWLLMGYCVYTLLVVQISSDVRWGHRTSLEFVLVLFVALALDRRLAEWPAFWNAGVPGDADRRPTATN